MSYQIINLYEAHGDGGERDTGPIIGYSLTRTGADDIARGKAWYGSNGDVRVCPAIKLDTGEIYALVRPDPIDIEGNLAKAREAQRNAALSKLTPDERRLLGLDK